MKKDGDLQIVKDSKFEVKTVEAVECPLAVVNPENIITESAVQDWLIRSQIAHNNGYTCFNEFARAGRIDTDALRHRYETELRFLSKSMMLDSLREFGLEILDKFSPSNTVFYLPKNSLSSLFLYRSLIEIFPNLATFAQLERGYRFSFNPTSELSDEDKIVNSIYLDDWVLSGDHLIQNVRDQLRTGLLHTYHMVVSSRGVKLMQKYPQLIRPRYKYVVPLDSSMDESYFPEVPVFGWHKIPDRITGYYAAGRDLWEHYSIFGATREFLTDVLPYYITRHTRMVDHSSTLQRSPHILETKSFF